jgi:hypothetical protein
MSRWIGYDVFLASKKSSISVVVKVESDDTVMGLNMETMGGDGLAG